MKKVINCALYFLLCIPVFSQVDFRKETIYFLITSRFFDGDSTNNAANEWCSYYPGNPNNANFSGPKDVTWRGDFRGLIQKLDYIKDLGFTAIWITPVVQNRGPLDYHGYHAWDFTKVDNRLLSPGAGFKDLIDAAHAKGIKIVLDIVTNHSGRYGIKGQAELKYNTDPNQPWGKDKNGNTLQDNPNWSYDGLTPNPDDGKTWSRANLAKMPPPYNSNLANYNWPSTESFVKTSDPNWFHQWGNGFVQGWDDTLNCYNGAIAGDCPDLNTGSQTVQDYFFNAYKQYIDMGIDGIRYDTWKHMNKADVFKMTDRFKAYNPNLFIFGEVAQKRFELHSVEELNPHWYTWRGATNNSQPSGTSVIDFYGEATFHNIFQDGGGFSGVTGAARYDGLYADPSQLVTWLDNHDFGPNNDWNMRYSGTDENLAACMNFMFTWRGIPSVYYGTEMRFKSGAYTDLHDAAGINKSIDVTGRAYYGDVMNNAPNHIIYKHIKRLNAIRKAIPALQNGAWQWGGNAPGNGVGFTRRSGSSFVAVGLAKDGAASFNFTGLDNGTYRDAVTGRVSTVTNGNLSFTVQSGSAGIYVLNGPGMIGENGAGFFENCVNCVSTPVVKISPASGNYSSVVTVILSATGGTAPYNIYYTTNGTTPTISSTKYTTSFTVNSRTIVRAIAVDAAGKISELDGQQYTFELPALTLKAMPGAGNYYTPQNITLTANGGKAPISIYYTTNGTTPTLASTRYTTPISVSTATTIKALAVDSIGTQTSLSASYTFIIPPPVVTASPTNGNYPNPPVTVTLNASSPKPPVRIHYTINGTTPTTASPVYTGPFQVTSPGPKVVKFIGVDSLNQISAPDSVKYTFNPIPDIWVYFKKPATWAAPKIHYWNSVPAGTITPTTWPGVNMTLECNDWYKFKFSGITATNLIFNDGAGKQTGDLTATATAYYDNGWLTTVPVMCPITNTPPVVTITPASANFTDSIRVSLSVTDDKAGSIIYYTTNGSTPTTASLRYTTAFWVKSTTTVKATAIDSDNVMATSIATATFTKTSANTPPVVTLSPASTTFRDSIRITILVTDNLPGSTVYYTTNGSVPTTSSIVYTGPFWVKTTTTVRATAMDADGAMAINSVSATYTKTANTPPVVSISPASSSFTDSIRVTLTVTDDRAGSTIYYTTNGSPATVTSTVYTSPFWIKSTTTVNATARDAEGAMAANAITATYTKTAPINNITVYFENTGGWAQPKVYCWSAVPTTYSCAAWPGTNMTKVANCGNWWSYTFAGVSSTNLIFNSGTGVQSVNLALTASGTYNYSWTSKTWANGIPGCNTPPVVSITPSSTTFADSLLVTLSVADDKAGSTIYYTTNGTAASASSPVYTAPFWVKATTTVNATAKDADGAMATAPATATYTKGSSGITVYFENTGGWTQPKVYCWSPVPSTYSCIAWPGSNLTKVTNCGNWWSFTFNSISSTNLIFNNGSGVQSADLSRTAAGIYNFSWTTKTWANGAPNCTGPKTPNDKLSVNIAPNPVTGNKTSLIIDSKKWLQAEIKIIDANGVVVQLIKKVNLSPGVNIIPVQLRNSNRGTFAAIVQTDDDILPVKFVIVN